MGDPTSSIPMSVHRNNEMLFLGSRYVCILYLCIIIGSIHILTIGENLVTLMYCFMMIVFCDGCVLL